MFNVMLLGPHHIIRKMNELCVKTDLTKVVYFGNNRSKVGVLICQSLTIFMFDL